MCGRYQFSAFKSPEVSWITEAVERQYGPGAWTPGDVRPGDRAPVLLPGEGDRPAVGLFTWGYPSENRKIINARAETAAVKPMFQEGVQRKRCVIPSTGFYEWDGQKRKYLFKVPGSDTVYMAGVYEQYTGKPHFCILTTEANVSVREVHHRMPLVLTGEQVTGWLGGGPAASGLLSSTPPALEKESQEAQLSLW